ncbi:MAG: peptidoglycan-binding protein [Alphaproteobacteria bacterium]|nr:peptidoglycan-binding protein [Alphaproteobacteria bacterium]
MLRTFILALILAFSGALFSACDSMNSMNSIGSLLPQGSQALVEPPGLGQPVPGRAPFGHPLFGPSVFEAPPVSPTLAGDVLATQPLFGQALTGPPFGPLPIGTAQPGTAPRTAAVTQPTLAPALAPRPALGSGYDPRPRVRYRPPTGYASAQRPGPPRDYSGQSGSALQTAPVAEVETLLVRLGMQPGPIDGVMTVETRDAILAYAALIGLRSDGTVTAELLQQLRQDANALGLRSDARQYPAANGGLLQPASFDRRQPLSAPAIGVAAGRSAGALPADPAIIGEIQRMLTGLGHGLGPIDGTLNAATMSAIAAYQNSRGMVVDGQASGPLLANLRTDATPGAIKRMGPANSMGNGQVSTYVEYAGGGVPTAIGVVMSGATLTGLPLTLNDPRRCYDLNGDGRTDPTFECLAIGEIALALPDPGGGGLPIRWVGLNWLPQGLGQRSFQGATIGSKATWPTAWAIPHLGFHFYMQDYDVVQTINTGLCGDLVDCDRLADISFPPTPEFLPPGYVAFGGALPLMGNHLVNAMAPEIVAGNPALFSHGFAYGSQDGVLSFFEVKATPQYLAGMSNECFPIALPRAFPGPGLYPSAYCVRPRPELNGVSVSLEGLIQHPGGRNSAVR